MPKLIALVIAAAIGGGIVGALATAAEQAAASPQAIAAAVARVQDTKSEQSLAKIATSLKDIDSELQPSAAAGGRTSAYDLLDHICINTAPGATPSLDCQP